MCNGAAVFISKKGVVRGGGAAEEEEDEIPPGWLLLNCCYDFQLECDTEDIFLNVRNSHHHVHGQYIT